MPSTTEFRLDNEQRQQVRECLRKGGIRLVEPFDDFVHRIQSSCAHFRTAKPETTFRHAHNKLRDVAILSREGDPSPALLRARLKVLQPQVLEAFARRAPAVIPRLFPDEIFDVHSFEAPGQLAARFLDWAESASAEELVRALRSLSADGGRWIEGRSRGRPAVRAAGS
jgi:hypothetical protein